MGDVKVEVDLKDCVQERREGRYGSGRKQDRSKTILLDQPLLAKPLALNLRTGFEYISKVKRVDGQHE